MSIHILGVDLGKNICSLAGLDAAGAVVFRKRIQRHRLLAVLSQIPRCVVAMVACGGAHHVARFCQAIGHEPRLMSPYYVRPYVKVHKTDDRDAVAIAEAASRPTMSFVTIKTAEQLDLQALHRARVVWFRAGPGWLIRPAPFSWSAAFGCLKDGTLFRGRWQTC